MFDGKSLISFFPNFIRQGLKPNKESNILKEVNTEQSQLTEPKTNQTKPGESLVNTNSNIPLNQTNLTSPVLSQTTLNTVNKPNINQNTNDAPKPNEQIRSSDSGTKDLPAYAGITNISLKSWASDQTTKNLSDLKSGEKELSATKEGIKGFQNQNYEGSEDSGSNKNQGRSKNLLILSQMFGNLDQGPLQETNLLINLTTFKKLGSNKNNDENFSEEDLKKTPPSPLEAQFLDKVSAADIKSFSQILGLPNGFSEFIRLIAKDNIEIYKKDMYSFLEKRLKFVQEETFGKDKSINENIAKFAAVLGSELSPLLPLLLLYYPLPLPMIRGEEFIRKGWNKKNKSTKNVIASCEIYYLSYKRGRFLISFELCDNEEFIFNIQTNEENNGIVKDIEKAIAESMDLLYTPPLLSDLNVLLTKEIYNATDNNEELAIVSSGPIRLEIVLATYSTLLILNSLQNDPDPAGIIDVEIL